MTLRTWEALDAVPEGTQVLVRSGSGTSMWTRTKEGLVRDGLATPVAVALFEGYLKQGLVERVDPREPMVGDFYLSENRLFFVTSVTESAAGRIRGWLFSEAGYLRAQHRTTARMRRIEQVPNEFVSSDLFHRVREFYAIRVTELEGALATAQEALANKPESKPDRA